MTNRCEHCGRSLIRVSALATHGAITDTLGQMDEPLRETIIPLGEWSRVHLGGLKHGGLKSCVPVLFWRSVA
jgi:hypothetical protein